MRRFRTLIVGALLLTAFAAPARAQTAGKGGTLRTWPEAGAWSTALARRPDGVLQCLMLNAHLHGNQVEFVAGLRQITAELALVVGDILPGKLAGDHISLIVDNYRTGNFPIVRRVDDQGPMHTISAAIPPAEEVHIIKLLSTGKKVTFVTGQATYPISLTGAPQSLTNMRACVAEATKLNATANP
jgi:hypothetical protein